MSQSKLIDLRISGHCGLAGYLQEFEGMYLLQSQLSPTLTCVLGYWIKSTQTVGATDIEDS